MIKQGYLNSDIRPRQIRLVDMAVLLYHLHRGAQLTKVGFEDCNETLESLTRKLNKKVWIGTSNLESSLWSCNMLNELGEFWHPSGLTLEEFVAQMGIKNFDRYFHLIKDRKDD